MHWMSNLSSSDRHRKSFQTKLEKNGEVQGSERVCECMLKNKFTREREREREKERGVIVRGG